jgi:quercetin dioxygenase-like cupin family protein
MNIQHQAAFDQIAWQSPIAGVRHKFLDQNGVRLRLVEYSSTMPLHWCEKGHYGYLIEGRMEIEYDHETVVYQAGDGIFIPDGPAHRHRGRTLGDTALVFFIEKHAN